MSNFKAGERKKQNTDSPISILRSFGETFEKINASQLGNHIHKNNILIWQQFGFCGGISTENSVQSLLNQVWFACDNAEFVMGMIFDLT